MEKLSHTEYKRLVADSDTAILFVHGIVGTPNHFNTFIELVPDSISVYNILLDGHGGSVKDFSKTSMSKWEEQVDKIVDELLLSHKQLYIVAHSMGCLFAIEQAIKKPNISKLFLLAAPIKLFLKPRMFINSMKFYFNIIKEDDLVAVAAKNCCGLERTANVFDYMRGAPRYIELFFKISKTKKFLPSLNTPCLAFQSLKDEMVSKKSIKLLQENPFVSVAELSKSSHYYYDKDDFELLKTTFQKWINTK